MGRAGTGQRSEMLLLLGAQGQSRDKDDLLCSYGYLFILFFQIMCARVCVFLFKDNLYVVAKF